MADLHNDTILTNVVGNRQATVDDAKRGSHSRFQSRDRRNPAWPQHQSGATVVLPISDRNELKERAT
jgi:hypothetical protein